MYSLSVWGEQSGEKHTVYRTDEKQRNGNGRNTPRSVPTLDSHSLQPKRLILSAHLYIFYILIHGPVCCDSLFLFPLFDVLKSAFPLKSIMCCKCQSNFFLPSVQKWNWTSCVTVPGSSALSPPPRLHLFIKHILPNSSFTVSTYWFSAI